jgi:hypothetical protein
MVSLIRFVVIFLTLQLHPVPHWCSKKMGPDKFSAGPGVEHALFDALFGAG